MLVLGHAGITLGIAAVSFGVLNRIGCLATKNKSTGNNPSLPLETTTTHKRHFKNRASWFTSVASYIDIRFLLLGSLLPDVIDKPVGIYLFPQIFDSGRIFCHTLLFAILIFLAGLYLFRYSRKTWLLALSFGTFIHLILDQSWIHPETLFWPILGLSFGKGHVENWMGTIVDSLLFDPEAFIPELVGGAILIWFAALLVHRKKILAFIKYGQA